MTSVTPTSLAEAIANTRAHLLSLRKAAGHWEGELSSSALSTATAVVALHTVDATAHAAVIARGVAWLVMHQNADGGWGDTSISKSNLSTTLLCWSALHLDGAHNVSSPGSCVDRANHWIARYVGSLEPEAIANAVVARYGKDKTFSVPILMLCSICGTLGEGGWRRVLPLPFELAAFPRAWFGAIGLPVVSYALPALIAIGYTRFFHAPPAKWNPLRSLRAALWPRISPMLKTLQPSSGGYLEATPLTSFVTMALASADEKHHPCVPVAIEFLLRSQRGDGSWAIDTNLATWGTTLSVKALEGSADTPVRSQSNPSAQPQTEADQSVCAPIKSWLLAQQYRDIHPFTNAAPGGWAWTDLPGGVPDADDTSGALIALWHLSETDDERRRILPAIEAGITWLLDLQNRDGGMPTFCRGWGTLPFDRSTPEITAHALWAWTWWGTSLNGSLHLRCEKARARAVTYLRTSQRGDGSWAPLWFGNEHAPEEENPVFGTAQVIAGLCRMFRAEGLARAPIARGVEYLLDSQHENGGWGGASGIGASVEETGVAVGALASCLAYHAIPAGGPQLQQAKHAVQRGCAWLLNTTRQGTHFPASPIGLYFARLWYHENLYPVIWTLGAFQQAAVVLESTTPDPS
jgi:squalene-hopene/tetraprenyl-beta-curcumene cyclase